MTTTATTTTANTTPATVIDELMKGPLTEQHKWHQAAASSIFESGLADKAKNMFYKVPETELFVRSSTCIRELFFHLMGIDGNPAYPTSGFRDSKVVRAWFKIFETNPTSLLDSIREMPTDVELMQFVFIGTDTDYSSELVKESFDLTSDEAHAFMKQWWSEIREIARTSFADVTQYQVCSDDASKYTITLPKLVKLLIEHKDLVDLGYWDINADLLDNLSRCNLSVHRVIEHIREQLDLSRQDIRGRLSTEFYTAPSTYAELYQLDTISLDDASNAPSLGRTQRSRYGVRVTNAVENMFGAPMAKAYNDFCTYMFVNFSSENISDKARTQRAAMLEHATGRDGVVTLATWTYLLRHAGWFNQTHRYEESGVTTQHHGHDFIRVFLSKTPEELAALATPAELTTELFASKHKEVVDNLSGFKFPQLPADLAAQLPAGVEFISNPPQLYTEGTVMHHCCGGSGYMRSVSEGESWFFHITTESDTHGVTTELEYNTYREEWEDNQSRGLQNRMPEDNERAIITALVDLFNNYSKLPKNADWTKTAVQNAKTNALVSCA